MQMSNEERAKKQARYEELCAMEENQTDAEINEQTQLFYELYPEHQYWISETDHRTPQDIWHAY